MDSIKSRLDRLTLLGRRAILLLAKGPGYHYIYGRWQLGNRLQRMLHISFSPNTMAFLTELDPQVPELPEVEQAVRTGGADSALADLMAHFRTRDFPTFFFSHRDKEEIVSRVGGDQRTATIRAADEICQNIFHFRGEEPVQFKAGVDWAYRPRGNIDWTWDLNRHVYFETLGRAYAYTDDERYALKLCELLRDWLANNPAGVNQPNWNSVFEVAFRINTWIWAFYCVRSSAAFDDETLLAFLKGLLAHGRYLDTNLELHVRNNHLLLEAKALAALGVLFPEFKRAKRWQQCGLKILYRQIREQVCPDGVHGERATHYHRVIAGELLELLVLLENNDVPVPADIHEAFGRMVEFELWIGKPNGSIPLFGDSALEDTHLRFSAARAGPAFLRRDDLRPIAPRLDEASVWLLGAERVERYLDASAAPLVLGSRAFPEGGYFVMRSGQGLEALYLAFDCGPFGYRPTPNHGHADALSFDLYAFGQTLLVDPGVYSTHLGRDWRNFFRGSRAHNTVVVDDQDQSILLDAQRVYRPARTTLYQWISNDHFDFVAGSHDGYERLSEPITHHRQVLFVKPEYWVIIDWLTGQGTHCFDLYFHLMPGAHSQLDQRSKALYTGNGTWPGLAIVPLAPADMEAYVIHGTTSPIQGWVSFLSGEKQPAPVLCHRRVAMAPVHFCTLLYPRRAEDSASPVVLPLAVKRDGRRTSAAHHLTSLQIKTDTHVDYLIIEQEPTKTSKYFLGYETDAQITYLRHRPKDGKLVKAIVGGEGQLLFQGQPLSGADDSGHDLDCET
jgi:hypothetical protein